MASAQHDWLAGILRRAVGEMADTPAVSPPPPTGRIRVPLDMRRRTAALRDRTRYARIRNGLTPAQQAARIAYDALRQQKANAQPIGRPHKY